MKPILSILIITALLIFAGLLLTLRGQIITTRLQDVQEREATLKAEVNFYKEALEKSNTRYLERERSMTRYLSNLTLDNMSKAKFMALLLGHSSYERAISGKETTDIDDLNARAFNFMIAEDNWTNSYEDFVTSVKKRMTKKIQ